MASTQIVTSPTGLKRVLTLRRNSTVWIKLPSLAKDESACFELRINRLLAESGQAFAAMAGVVAITGCIFLEASHWHTSSQHALVTAGINLLLCLTATVFGKVAGLFQARWKLARLLWSIQALISERSTTLPNRSSGLQTRAS